MMMMMMMMMIIIIIITITIMYESHATSLNQLPPPSLHLPRTPPARRPILSPSPTRPCYPRCGPGGHGVSRGVGLGVPCRWPAFGPARRCSRGWHGCEIERLMVVMMIVVLVVVLVVAAEAAEAEAAAVAVVIVIVTT